MIEDSQNSCLYAMSILLLLNLIIIIWDRQVQDKILYVINAVLAGTEITTYFILESLPLGWGADYPHLGFLPFLWVGSIVGIVLLSYFILWDFLTLIAKPGGEKQG